MAPVIMLLHFLFVMKCSQIVTKSWQNYNHKANVTLDHQELLWVNAKKLFHVSNLSFKRNSLNLFPILLIDATQRKRRTLRK